MALDFKQIQLSEDILLQLRERSILGLIATIDEDAEFNFAEGGTEDTVKIAVLDAPTVIDYDPATGFASGPERPSNTAVEVEVDHYKGIYQVFDALENAVEYLEEYAQNGTGELVEAAHEYLFGSYADALAANQVTYDPSADDLIEKLEEGEANLSNQSVPDTDRVMAVTPSIMQGIRDDLATDGFEVADEVLQSPFFQGVWHGIEVYQMSKDRFPVTGTSTAYRHCLMGHRSAIRYADTLRGPKTVDASGRMGVEMQMVHAAAKATPRPEALVDFRILQ